jgi:hypothetical protein
VLGRAALRDKIGDPIGVLLVSFPAAPTPPENCTPPRC